MFAVMAVGFIALTTSTHVHAESSDIERIEWRKIPIEVALKIGAERQIQFPAPVKVGVPGDLQSKLRVQSVSDTVYLEANAPFDPTRIVVQTREGDHTYLLDVDATDKTDPTPALAIVDPEIKTAAENDDDSTLAASPRSLLDPVILTRFAAQQLYAPARLLKAQPGIVRVPVSSAPVDLLRGASLTAVPVIAWRAGSLHLTAVKLTNTSRTPLVLDPRALKGEWLTATFQHNRLLAAGSEADTTVVYLVSARPFAAAR